ncbi:PREDICTED: uncharacterized protein LOC105960049 [Erythranthe guttata]|uniref:uncharacterized protein LOC105960049 n=1 Tax=Erythranthe guttata TaxID=4155 RepID=UPI00064DA465|nr:PREDICTED: uncharacterized protein LOC105960049 [Erythranthe guttata]|eukprot:XP_012839673.1 PREDICTED: uncharacterized protein LOC105960049 [Erythranthe guttata]
MVLQLVTQIEMPRCVSSQKQTRSENAQWPFANEEFLIQHSYDYYLQGHLQNSTFSGKLDMGLMNIQRRLPGTGKDAAVIDGNKEYARMLNSGIPHYDNCTEMFYRTYATCSHARSGCQGPLDSDDEETVGGSIKQVSGGKRASTDFMATSDQDCGPSNPSNNQYKPCKKGKVNKTESMTTVMQQIGGMMEAKQNSWQVNCNDQMNECYRIIKRLTGLDSSLRMKALTEIKSATMRSMFLTMDDDDRLVWLSTLQG